MYTWTSLLLLLRLVVAAGLGVGLSQEAGKSARLLASAHPSALGNLEISLIGVCIGRSASIFSCRLVGESLPWTSLYVNSENLCVGLFIAFLFAST